MEKIQYKGYNFHFEDFGDEERRKLCPIVTDSEGRSVKCNLTGDSVSAVKEWIDEIETETVANGLVSLALISEELHPRFLNNNNLIQQPFNN